MEFDEENSDTALDMYLAMACDETNMISPILTQYMYDVTSHPMPSLLIHLAALECLQSNSIFQARNDVQYNNSGISIKMHDGQRYNSQITMLTNTCERQSQMFQKYKIQLNCNSCWGGTWSPYAIMNGRVPV